MDAREFVRFYIAQSNEITDYTNPDNNENLKIPFKSLRFDHCYMNLPVDAIEFLDVFIGLFHNANPRIWCKDSNDTSTL